MCQAAFSNNLSGTISTREVYYCPNLLLSGRLAPPKRKVLWEYCGTAPPWVNYHGELRAANSLFSATHWQKYEAKEIANLTWFCWIFFCLTPLIVSSEGSSVRMSVDHHLVNQVNSVELAEISCIRMISNTGSGLHKDMMMYSQTLYLFHSLNWIDLQTHEYCKLVVPEQHLKRRSLLSRLLTGINWKNRLFRLCSWCTHLRVRDNNMNRRRDVRYA